MMFHKDAENSKAAIFSLSGLALSDGERALFRQSNPLGFILFARNCETPDQLRALTDSLKECVGRDCPILIDQEGGRVQRLKPPIWKGFPAMRLFGGRAAHDEKAARDDLDMTIRQLAEELRRAGVNVDCAPVLDVLQPETHDVIGDRAFSDNPEIVAKMGEAACRTFLAAGIMPVIKHIPGHGRATLDSHKALPRVTASLQELEDTDFVPFRALAKSNIGAGLWGMSAHVVYEAIDSDHPASVSAKVIEEVIRGSIGFDGFLVGDDLDMQALDAYGDVERRAALSLDAGCDAVLYCSGKLKAMEKLAESVPNLSENALRRLQKGDEISKVVT